jgi:TRAP-type mannitol/chloroaromatic compound transport system substrate-binding protein
MIKRTAKSRRQALAIVGAGVAVTAAAPAVLRASERRRWRCVTSWTRNLPGPGVSAHRIAERITLMSEGALTIDVFAAGELVPPLQVLDAVASGTIEMGHTAALFWSGKMPAAPIFTTVPFGPGPVEHMAWLRAGGGQDLWDELYAPFGVKPFVGGNTGPSAAGWFRREINAVADVKGLRIRATGLGGEVYAMLGAIPQAIPPGDTYAALERGVVDAVELLAPANDLPLGFNRIAPFYVFPGLNKPNGVSEVLIGRARWDALPPNLKMIVEAACQMEHDIALGEAHAANGLALAKLAQLGTQFRGLPDTVVVATQVAARAVLDRVATTSPLAGRVVASLRDSMIVSRRWTTLTRSPDVVP